MQVRGVWNAVKPQVRPSFLTKRKVFKKYHKASDFV